SLARWRCPGRKFGTVSVRSMAAFSVTVTITSAHPAPDVLHGLPCIPSHAAHDSGTRDGAGGDERAPRKQPPVLVERDLAEAIAPLDGETRRTIGDRSLHDRIRKAHGAIDRTRGHESYRTPTERRRGSGVGRSARDHRQIAVPPAGPGEE